MVDPIINLPETEVLRYSYDIQSYKPARESSCFSQNLSVLLQLCDVDIVTFSALIGVVPKTVYFWLDGKSSPSDQIVNDIRRFFSLPNIDLLHEVHSYEYFQEIICGNIIYSLKQKNDKLTSDILALQAKNKELTEQVIIQQSHLTVSDEEIIKAKYSKAREYNIGLTILLALLVVFAIVVFSVFPENTTVSSTRTASVSNVMTKQVSATVYVTSSGSKYHRSGCRYVKGKSNVLSMPKSSAIAAGYDACSVCNP